MQSGARRGAHREGFFRAIGANEVQQKRTRAQAAAAKALAALFPGPLAIPLPDAFDTDAWELGVLLKGASDTLVGFRKGKAVGPLGTHDFRRLRVRCDRPCIRIQGLVRPQSTFCKGQTK